MLFSAPIPLTALCVSDEDEKVHIGCSKQTSCHSFKVDGRNLDPIGCLITNTHQIQIGLSKLTLFFWKFFFNDILVHQDAPLDKHIATFCF